MARRAAGGRPRTRTEPLPPGALVPSLTAANTHDRTAVVGALGRVLELIGRPRRIGLVVPDVVAKVSLVRFEQVPPKRSGSRPARPLAGPQGGAVPDRRGPGQLRAGHPC